jgi:hypothetical protein
MNKLLILLGVFLFFRTLDADAGGSKNRSLQFVQKRALETYLETYKAQNPNADSCPSSIFGIHGVVEWDGYGYLADFAGTNHLLYYSYNSPDTSLVDSTLPGCQQFADIMNLSQTQFDRAFLSPGIQWANNNNCPTIIGCGPLDDDGQVTSADRMVLAIFNISNTVPYKTKMLVDTVRYNETYARFAFDDSIGDGGGGSGIRHRLFMIKAPIITSAVCAGDTCKVVLVITEPSYDSTGATGGLYGDDYQIASHLIAGYKVVAMISSSVPTSAIVNDSNWNMEIEDLDRYIPGSKSPVGGVRVSHPISLHVTGLEDVYFAYVPIFNKDSACQASECTAAELQVLDQLGGSINNSLAGRVASAGALSAQRQADPGIVYGSMDSTLCYSEMENCLRVEPARF